MSQKAAPETPGSIQHVINEAEKLKPNPESETTVDQMFKALHKVKKDIRRPTPYDTKSRVASEEQIKPVEQNKIPSQITISTEEPLESTVPNKSQITIPIIELNNDKGIQQSGSNTSASQNTASTKETNSHKIPKNESSVSQNKKETKSKNKENKVPITSASKESTVENKSKIARKRSSFFKSLLCGAKNEEK
jgi:hypothetical protein